MFIFTPYLAQYVSRAFYRVMYKNIQSCGEGLWRGDTERDVDGTSDISLISIIKRLCVFSPCHHPCTLCAFKLPLIKQRFSYVCQYNAIYYHVQWRTKYEWVRNSYKLGQSIKKNYIHYSNTVPKFKGMWGIGGTDPCSLNWALCEF